MGGHISVCRHVTLKHNSFWRYKPVMISKRYPKFKELKRMLITETSSFHFHGASDLQYVLFLLLRVFFNLVCDPKLILQISGTFQQSCRKLHRKTEEADNAVKVVLSKLSSCCDELGKMDLDDSTIENMCSDMAASMEAVERHEVEISAYQANIRTTSHDMLLLYSGSRDIEVGPLLLKLQHIF